MYVTVHYAGMKVMLSPFTKATYAKAALITLSPATEV